ncbi:serine/threonine-protein kinase [Streptosporangium canum]|uniref:serine/threonine-protein kinase n=1 Tax=Streptosporangium canum TaxID=324952 RepID=UPI0036C8945F
MPGDRSRVLAGRYRLQAPLGEGGMGLVWRAWDELLQQTVAVKEVSLSAGLTSRDRAERLRRTLREARTAATLRGHPGIVTVYDVVEQDGLPWIVMELVEGPSMAQVIRAERRLPEDRVARIGLQVISALAAAEAAGVVHRDVKPANILLTDGRAVLTDFGISAAAHETTDLTGTGQLLGTPAYLAPEQIEGERASAASDLWAVGVTLYEAVEGRRPFERESTAATIAAIVSLPPAPARHVDRLRPVIDGLLRKDPAERLTAGQATALLSPAAAGAGQGQAALVRSPGSSNPAGGDDGPAWEDAGLRSTGDDGPAQKAAPQDVGLRTADDDGPAREAAPEDAGLRSASAAASRRPYGRVAMAAGSALVAVAVVVTVIWGIQRIPSGGGITPTSGATGSSAPSHVRSPGPSGRPAASTVPAALPRGFTLHRDRRGFSLAVPDGWTKEESEDQVSWERPGSSTLSPSSSSWILGVFADPGSKETGQPTDILNRLRDTLQKDMIAADSYQELSRRPVPSAGERAAELEFGFAHRDAPGMRFRFYARCVIRDSGDTGILWFFAPAEDWAEASTHIDTFVETFRLD